MPWKFIPAKQDIEDDFCATFLLGRTTIGSWCTMPTKRSYKKRHQFACTPTSGTPSAVPEERPRETQDEGSVPDSSPWCGLCLPRRGSWAKSLRGTRDGLIWEEVLACVCVCVCLSVYVCVCVCVTPFCSFLMWIHEPIHLPSTQHYSISWLYTCSIWSLHHLLCVLIDSHEFFLLL